MAAETTPEVRILPTLWTGFGTGSSWGVTSLHHPKQHLRDEPDLDWHDITDLPVTMKVLRQSGRNLELVFITGTHEDRGVGALTGDGSLMIAADVNSSCRFEIDGDRMTGLRTVHHLDAGSGDVRFGATVLEFKAGA
jgi:hypothetical protein